MKSRYSLRFELRPAEADRLIIGQLHFLRDGVIINTVRATSSLPGRQYPGSWEVKGGLLPPSKVLPKGKSYIMDSIRFCPLKSQQFGHCAATLAVTMTPDFPEALVVSS
jgi:hypothetical protein